MREPEVASGSLVPLPPRRNAAFIPMDESQRLAAAETGKLDPVHMRASVHCHLRKDGCTCHVFHCSCMSLSLLEHMLP
jgi:hypothetical protein